MGQRSLCSTSEYISHRLNRSSGAPALHPAQQHYLSYSHTQKGTYLCIQVHLCALMSVHNTRGSRCPQDSVTQEKAAVTVVGDLPATQQLCFDRPAKVTLFQPNSAYGKHTGSTHQNLAR